MIRKLMAIIAVLTTAFLLAMAMPINSAEAASLDDYMTAEQKTIRNQVNALRASQGKSQLAWNDNLNRHAQVQVQALASGREPAFPDAPTGWTYGFTGRLSGTIESSQTSGLFEKRWSKSTDDVATMTRSDATAISVGLYYQGSTAYVVVEIVAANLTPATPALPSGPTAEEIAAEKARVAKEAADRAAAEHAAAERVAAERAAAEQAAAPVASEPEPAPVAPVEPKPASTPTTSTSPTQPPATGQPTPSPTPSTETSVPAADAPASEEDVKESIREKLDAERAAEVRTTKKTVLKTAWCASGLVGFLALLPLPFLRYRKPPVRSEQPEDPMIDDGEQ